MTQTQRDLWLSMLFAFSIAFAVVQPDIAFAQSTVDVRPALNEFLSWLQGILMVASTALIGVGIRFVTGKIGLQGSELEASLNARLDEIIHKGIDYAYTTAINEVNKPGSGLEAVKVDNFFLSLVLSYVVDSAPEIIARFGLTPTRIEDMIKARLPAYMGSIPVEGGLPSVPTPAMPATA